MSEPCKIIFSDNGFQELTDFLVANDLNERKVFILADENTSKFCLPFLIERAPILESAEVMEIKAMESSKNLDVVNSIYGNLISSGADRQSLLINLGGGVVSDIGGFVASTFKRGMRYINLPTTLLAQVDAAIGGKTGVNLDHYKNMIGTFYLPELVFVNSSFLNTLGKDQVMSGFAELLKHALIADHDLWEKLERMKELSLPLIKSLVKEGAEIKSRIVASDLHENGARKKLNFGHTVGHALETFAMESFTRNLLHGEAVALGMMCECHISSAMSGLKKGDLDNVARFIARHFKSYELDKMSYHRIIEIISQDKKKDGDKINMTLLKGIGDSVINQNPRSDLIIDSLNFMNRYPFKG
jgi:3-dehydroquinate synthase